jgi:hypothetical protein
MNAPNSKTASASSSDRFDIPGIDETTKRIRDLNEQVIEASKKAGSVSLDAYEKALSSLVQFEEKAASATQLEWVSAVASTHATFISDVSSAYIKAARELLK